MTEKKAGPPVRKASKAVRDRIVRAKKQQAFVQERKLNNELVERTRVLEQELEAMRKIRKASRPFSIKPKPGVKSQATAVLVASDWHIEEVVHQQQVNGLNEFNKGICAERVARFFRHGLKLVEKERNATHIDTLILALLGDFISGSIHEELVEGNRLLPIHAILEVQEHIAAGIKYLLDNSNLKLVIPCASGNHGRITKKVHISTEMGNSLEYMMYCSLAERFSGNKRVTFVIQGGYHTYVEVYDKVVRFHHGHSVKYAGGVGGITIPLNKAIFGWNRGRRADLDVLGHFHQFFDGGNFIVNGSLIGFNAFALSIKASPEPPVQAFFLIDSGHGKTVVCPVILDKDR